MKNAYLLYNFNPYHNRQIKRFETVQEYTEAAESYYIDSKKRNFSYNDGVQTSIDVYCKSNLTVLDNQDNPDYLILTDENDPAVIDSRWFVIDTTKRCGNMYTLTLRRDLVADSYEKILDCPAYIEKATVNPADPFIFNQENVNVNKIKEGETLLKDESGCAWVVGYLATDAVTGSTTVSGGPARIADYTFANETSFQNGFSKYDACQFATPTGSLPGTATTPEKRADKYRIDIAYGNGSRTDGIYRAITARWKPEEEISILGNEFGYKTEAELYTAYPGITTFLAYTKNTIWANIWANNVCSSLNSSRSSLASLIASFGSQSFNNPFSTFENKIFKIGNTYYRAQSKVVSSTTVINNTLSMQDDNTLVNLVNDLDWDDKLSTTYKCIRTGYEVRNVVLEFVTLTEGQVNIPLTGSEASLNNIPYKMFAVPYKKDSGIDIYSGGTKLLTMAGDLAISVANIMSKAYSGAGSLYDIQLLPYCPIRDIIDEDGLLVPSDSSRYSYIEDGATPANKIGIVYWCEENTFTFNIEYNLEIENPKIESITEMYRLSSPNWNGQFEFNPAKNGGIKYFNVDCTYKPFTPYIHINPNFGRLYGTDYDDARGLICSGDFSLPQIYDQWQTYELQNKNYQNQFDRQIENLEFTQSVAMKKAQMGVLTGVASGAISGASIGNSLGGGYGAAAGALLGGAASIAGGMQDLYYQKQLNNEVIDYTQDQFRMNLENIQALPDSLKQVGAFTANNKIFPVLEYYTCTPEEKEAIALKFRYNGMTVERIGTIREFLQEEESYIKCKLIRINMLEDNHFIEALAEELNKGVFIK